MLIKKVPEERKDDNRWIMKQTGNTFIKYMYKCPKCEKTQFGKSAFCPNCGMKMNGVTKE